MEGVRGEGVGMRHVSVFPRRVYFSFVATPSLEQPSYIRCAGKEEKSSKCVFFYNSWVVISLHTGWFLYWCRMLKGWFVLAYVYTIFLLLCMLYMSAMFMRGFRIESWGTPTMTRRWNWWNSRARSSFERKIEEWYSENPSARRCKRVKNIY